MIKKNVIPINKLKEYSNSGILIFHLDNNCNDLLDLDIANVNMHRDDYYLFLLLDKCNAHITIDFKDFEVSDKSILYIIPGQVQSNLPKFAEWAGWVIAIEPNLIDEYYRTILNDNILNHKSLTVNNVQFDTIEQCLVMINNLQKNTQNSLINNRIIRSMLDAFTGMFTEVYLEQQTLILNTDSRPFAINAQFRKLLSDNFKTMKSPSEYAKALNISVSYLNQVVKSITGNSVSHWIQHEIILEAKRLLYYSNLNVKEIAFTLGYDDHTYFSRLFSNNNNMSPLQFRNKYRE